MLKNSELWQHDWTTWFNTEISLQSRVRQFEVLPFEKADKRQKEPGGNDETTFNEQIKCIRAITINLGCKRNDEILGFACGLLFTLCNVEETHHCPPNQELKDREY